MKNNYKLSIFGDTYSIVSDESSAHITQAAAMVDSLMKEIATKLSQVEEKRIAILVALQYASKYLALQSSCNEKELKQQELLSYLERNCLSPLEKDK